MITDKSLREIEHAAWSQRAETYDALFASISTQAIRDILDSLRDLEGKRHLDVACGTGHLVAAASRRGAASEGVDFAEPMIKVARTTYPRDIFKVADATQLPYDDCSFDAVTSSFGLSHMEDPQAAVDEAYRVLKPNGHFVFTLWFGAEDGNELQKIVKDAIATFATTSITLPEKWTLLRFANKQACEAITRQSGFSTPTFKKLLITFQTASMQQAVDIIDKLSVRANMMIESQPPAMQRQIHAYIVSKIEARRIDGIITLAWPALLIVVQKPE